MKTSYIYGLFDPKTHEIKYIGKTDNVDKRLKKHLNEYYLSKPSLKNNWIKSLIRQNLLPELQILDEIPMLEWKFWEQHYISLYKSWGFNLKNMTIGGDGGDTYSGLSEERKKERNLKASKALYGRKASSATRAKLSENAKNRMYSIKTREKMSKIRQDKIGNLHPASIQIVQFDKSNNFVCEYESISQAEKSTKIPSGNILRVCNGERKTAGNYIWQYKNKENKKFINKRYLPVDQFDLNNNYIATYESTSQAALNTNSLQSCISACLNDVQKKHNNFIWKKHIN